MSHRARGSAQDRPWVPALGASSGTICACHISHGVQTVRNRCGDQAQGQVVGMGSLRTHCGAVHGVWPWAVGRGSTVRAAPCLQGCGAETSTCWGLGALRWGLLPSGPLLPTCCWVSPFCPPLPFTFPENPLPATCQRCTVSASSHPFLPSARFPFQMLNVTAGLLITPRRRTIPQKCHCREEWAQTPEPLCATAGGAAPRPSIPPRCRRAVGTSPGWGPRTGHGSQRAPCASAAATAARRPRSPAPLTSQQHHGDTARRAAPGRPPRPQSLLQTPRDPQWPTEHRSPPKPPCPRWDHPWVGFRRGRSRPSCPDLDLPTRAVCAELAPLNRLKVLAHTGGGGQQADLTNDYNCLLGADSKLICFLVQGP